MSITCKKNSEPRIKSDVLRQNAFTFLPLLLLLCINWIDRHLLFTLMPIWLSFFHSWSFFVILGDHQCASSFTFTGKQLHEHCTKCVPLCYTEYRKIYRFGETWGWVNDNRSLTTVGRWVKPPYLILISRAEPSKPNQPCLREKREKMSWSRMFRRLLHMWGAVYLSFWLAARQQDFQFSFHCTHILQAERFLKWDVWIYICLFNHCRYLDITLTRKSGYKVL